jgi:hypothetical protein
MDINQFFRMAESKGLEAINAIRGSRASTPTNTISKPLYSSQDLYTPLRQNIPSMPSVVSIATPSFAKVEIYPKKLYEPVYTPMQSPVSLVSFTDKGISQITKAYPAKLTSDTKPFELPKIETFPKISEMIFGEPAKRFNDWANNLPTFLTEQQDTQLRDLKTEAQKKLEGEIARGQGDSFNADVLRGDIRQIDNAQQSNSFFIKQQIISDLNQKASSGELAAGNVNQVKNVWSAITSVFDQYTKSEEDKKKVQQQNEVTQDGVTKFLDNVLIDLRPTEQNVAGNLVESIGGMAGMFYVASLAKTPWLATLIGTGLESIAEGGATYDENRKKGMSIEEAFNREKAVIAGNVILNYVTNRFSGIFDDVSEQAIKSFYKKAVNVLGTAGIESIQEGSQQVISNLATDRPYNEGLMESMGFGAIFGGGLQTFKIVHNPTNKTIVEKKITPNQAKLIVQDSLSIINGVAGTQINENSSMDEITKAYYQAVVTASDVPNANSLFLRLDGAYQTLNSYKNATGKIKFKSEIDPNGTMSNREFAKKKTEQNLIQKEKVRNEEKNYLKKKYNDLAQWYTNWVLNIETQGKAFQLIDEIAEKRLGRKLKPGESVDIPFDELFQLSNIVESSPEYQTIVEIAKEIQLKKLSVDEFGQYLESKRNLSLYEAGAKKDVNVIDDTRTVAGFEPTYGNLAKKYYNAMNSIAEMIWQNNLITTEEYIGIIKNNDYAPFYKIFNEQTQPVVNQLQKSKQVGLGKQTVVRKIESTNIHDVENPYIMSIAYIANAYRQVQKNKVGLALINAIETGDVQGAGFQGTIVQTAEDGRLRRLIKDIKPEVDKIVEKTTKLLRKQKKSARVLQKEINDLIQRGFKINQLESTEQEDTTTQNRLTRKIETQLGKRDELMQDAEDIFQDILKEKRKGEEVLNDTKYLNRANRLLEKRNEWASDLINIGADLLGKRKGSQMRDKNGKVLGIKERRNLIKTASQRELFSYLIDLYDLPLPEFKKLLNTAIKKNLKIKSVLEEIEAIKNDRVTNIVVNNLIKLPSAEIDALYNKYGKTQKAIGKVITELKRLTDARITNAAVNSLIKRTPQELINIKSKLEKRYPIIENLIQDILDTQQKLDDESGYSKRLAEIEDELKTASTAGLETVEAFKDGYVIKAVVDKTLGESLKVTNTPESINNIFRFLNFFTQALKLSTVVVDPQAAPRLFLYDQQTAALFSQKPFQTSALNPLKFGEALITTLTSGPFASQIYSVLPQQLQTGINKWNEWQQFGGASSELFLTNKKETEKWLRAGGKNKITFGGVATFLGKLDQITKFQIFNVMKQEYLNQGFTEEEAGRRAGYDSRNTLPNFYRRSKTLRMIDILKPFTAAAVQSAAKLRDSFRKDPQVTTDRLMYMAMFYAFAMLWNLSTEERRKAWAALPDYVKRNKLPLFFEEVNENNLPYYTEIPVDQNVMNTLQGIRKSMEGIASADAPELMSGLSDMFAAMFGFKIPTTDAERGQELAGLNPVVRLPWELIANYDFYRNQPIVPQRLQGNPAYQQYDEKTSELAKLWGRTWNFDPKNGKYGVSPMKIDHVLKSFGRISTYLDNALKDLKNGTATPEQKEALNKYEGTIKGLLYKDVYTGEAQKVYEDKAKADLERASLNFDISEALKAGDLEKAKELANGKVTKQQWAGIESAYQESKIAETLTGKEKAYFNMPKSYLETIKKNNPEESASIDKVLNLKKTTTKLPNIDTSGIKFLPSTSGGGSGVSLKISKVKAPSIKATGVRRIAMPKPKKLKVKKAPKPKKIRVAKLKPIKRTRNI